jgi:hypothetical protein
VSTYPQTFPATFTSQCSEGIGPVQFIYLITSQNQLNRIRAVVSALNTAVRTAAGAEGFEVLDAEKENLFAGHEVCTSDSWVNQVNGWANPSPDDESLHPTTTGYQHWASALKTYLGG